MDRCKVRPFERNIGFGDQTIRVRGVVGDNGYILAADSIGFEIKLRTLEIGRDEKGQFAVLEKGEDVRRDGAIVKVEPGDSGLEISVAKVAPDETIHMAQEVCRLNHVDPGAVNLIVPNDWSISVFFDRAGNIDGSACSLKAEKWPYE